MNHFKLLPKGAQRIISIYYENEKSSEISRRFEQARGKLIIKNEIDTSIFAELPFLKETDTFLKLEYDRLEMAEYYYNKEININCKTPITTKLLKKRGFYQIYKTLNVWHFGNQESGIELQPLCLSDLRHGVRMSSDSEWMFSATLSCYSSYGGKNFKPMNVSFTTMEELEQLIEALQLNQERRLV